MPSKTWQRLFSLLLFVTTVQLPLQNRLTCSSVGLAKGVIILFVFFFSTASEAVRKIRRLEGKRRQTARPVYWYQSFCCQSKRSYLIINFDQRELSCCENEKQCQLSHEICQWEELPGLWEALSFRKQLLASENVPTGPDIKRNVFTDFQRKQERSMAWMTARNTCVMVNCYKGCFNL